MHSILIATIFIAAVMAPCVASVWSTQGYENENHSAQ